MDSGRLEIEDEAAPLQVTEEDRGMLRDLADLAALPDRVIHAPSENAIPPARGAEQAFSLGSYAGAFSFTELPDGVIYRTLVIARSGQVPDPGAVMTVAEALGFTGARQQGETMLPGSDWNVNLVVGPMPGMLVMQPARRPNLN